MTFVTDIDGAILRAPATVNVTTSSVVTTTHTYTAFTAATITGTEYATVVGTGNMQDNKPVDGDTSAYWTSPNVSRDE